MKPVPSSCRTDAVSEPRTPLCFSLYLGSPWHQSVPHPAPPRQSSASAIPNCSVLVERCFDLLLLAALIYPADWLTAHLAVPLASDLQQPNHGSAGANNKNHIFPESPSFTGAVIRTNSQRADVPVMDRVPACWNAFLCTVHWLRMIP